ncbi:mCG141515, partial [Mus musculus]
KYVLGSKQTLKMIKQGRASWLSLPTIAQLRKSEMDKYDRLVKSCIHG